MSVIRRRGNGLADSICAAVCLITRHYSTDICFALWDIFVFVLFFKLFLLSLLTNLSYFLVSRFDLIAAQPASLLQRCAQFKRKLSLIGQIQTRALSCVKPQCRCCSHTSGSCQIPQSVALWVCRSTLKSIQCNTIWP